MASLRRLAICSAIVTSSAGLGGCEQVLAIAAEPTFQATVLTNVASHIVQKIFDILISPAQAETVVKDNRPAPRTAEDCKKSTNLNAPCEAAQAEAATATLAAYKELQGRFGCHFGEPSEACQVRFRDAVEREADVRIVASRAADFAKAWPACRDSIKGGDNHEIMVAADDCMSTRGFKEEIDAMNLVYYNYSKA